MEMGKKYTPENIRLKKKSIKMYRGAINCILRPFFTHHFDPILIRKIKTRPRPWVYFNN